MNKNSFSFLAAVITLALTGGAATATGCGSVSTSSLCADICACERCTSNDLQACEDSGDKAAQAADAVGCSSDFDDAVACAGEHVTCENDHAVFEGCELEQAALTKCSSTLSVFGKNPCELASDVLAARFTSCGVTVNTSSGSGGSTVECSDAIGVIATCQAACIAAADCTILVNDSNNPPTPEQAKAFTDCFQKCQ